MLRVREEIRDVKKTRIIGYRNTDCIKRWLSEQGIPARSINGKLRYDTYEIARKLVEART